MSQHELELRGCGGRQPTTAAGPTGACTAGRAGYALRRLFCAALAAVALGSLALPAAAQQPGQQPGGRRARQQQQTTPTPPPAMPADFGKCPPLMEAGQPLFSVPEIAAQNNRLRGTVMLADEQRWMSNRIPDAKGNTFPTDKSGHQCFHPYVRYFRGLNTVQYQRGANGAVGAVPYDPRPADAGFPLPQPGPTLRARVGDIVQLTFFNQINPNDFPLSSETKYGGGCDEGPVGPGGKRYPNNIGDKYPDCFHGSSTGNIHFHGTHTNPNSTGDNVFIEVRPALRDREGKVADRDTIMAKTNNWFEEFYRRCEQELGTDPLRLWPKSWADLPKGWTDDQLDQLRRYDRQLARDYPNNVARSLAKIDEAQLRQSAWPQYYIGAFPYCYRLPAYPTAPPPQPGPPPAGTAGAGTAETGHEGMGMGGAQVAVESPAPLMMGQAPGTHWYHAHKHGSTYINVSNGMTGAFIIEGQYDDDLNTFYGPNWTRTQPLLVVNQLGGSPNLMTTAGNNQDKGPDFSVNGQLKPVLTMRPGEVQMWRIVNTSPRAAMYIADAPAGFEWRQLAQDGVQFEDANYKNRPFRNATVASGNRVDLLVRAPAAPCPKAGGCLYPVMVKNIVDPADLGQAQPLTLFSVNVVDDPKNPIVPGSNATKFIPAAPSFPSFLNSIPDADVKGTKVMTFASTSPGKGGMQTIDNKKFDGEVGQVVLLDTTEEWKIQNATYGPPISHPFHIHINPFQVTEVFNPNEALLNPDSGRPYPQTKEFYDPQTNQPAVKYAFHRDKLLPGQCFLDPDQPAAWVPLTWTAQGCVPAAGKTDMHNIWWDVFPIPSGYAPVFLVRDSSGKPVKDPKTGSQVTNPVLNQDHQAVQVPGHFKMRSRFVDYAGYYVLHCHILAHEDRGMMTIVEVAPLRTPYSHH